MRDYTKEITPQTLEKLIDITIENDMDMDVFTGSLQDNYIIYGTDGIKIGKAQPRKYIVIEEQFKTTWTSKMIMTMTDDITKVDYYKEKFEN